MAPVLILGACRKPTTLLAPRRSKQIALKRPGTGKVDSEVRGPTKQAPRSQRSERLPPGTGWSAVKAIGTQSRTIDGQASAASKAAKEETCANSV